MTVYRSVSAYCCLKTFPTRLFVEHCAWINIEKRYCKAIGFKPVT